MLQKTGFVNAYTHFCHIVHNLFTLHRALPNLHNITKKIAKYFNMLSLRRCNNQKQSGSSLATARKPTPSERYKKAFVFLVIQEDESLNISAVPLLLHEPCRFAVSKTRSPCNDGNSSLPTTSSAGHSKVSSHNACQPHSSYLRLSVWTLTLATYPCHCVLLLLCCFS